MRICILTTSFPAYEGHFQSPFILKLAESLVDNGLDVDVVCPFYAESKAKEEIINGVKVHRFQYLYPITLQRLHRGGGLPNNLKKGLLSKLELILYSFSFLLKSFKYAKKVDIIHAQWSLSGLVGIILKKIYKKPLIVSTRGIEVDIALKSKLMKPILRFVLENCDFVTPNNIHHVDEIAKLGVSKKKISPVPNGVDLNLYKPRDKMKLRKKLSIAKEEKVVLFVGWFIERKGVNYLVQSFPKVLALNKNAVLYLIGDGSFKKSIEKIIFKLGINKNIKILKSMSPKDVALWIAVADVFVLPSLAEGRPNVIYEAMLSGVPVIATNIGGTNELIKDGETGILVKPKDSDTIGEKINMLLNNEKLSKRLGEEARRYILSLNLSWNECAKRFISIYKKALK